MMDVALQCVTPEIAEQTTQNVYSTLSDHVV